MGLPSWIGLDAVRPKSLEPTNLLKLILPPSYMAAATVPVETVQYAATLDDIQAAAARIAGHGHITPVLTCSTLDRLAGHNLHFKAEVFQKGYAVTVTCVDPKRRPLCSLNAGLLNTPFMPLSFAEGPSSSGVPSIQCNS